MLGKNSFPSDSKGSECAAAAENVRLQLCHFSLFRCSDAAAAAIALPHLSHCSSFPSIVLLAAVLAHNWIRVIVVLVDSLIYMGVCLLLRHSFFLSERVVCGIYILYIHSDVRFSLFFTVLERSVAIFLFCVYIFSDCRGNAAIAKNDLAFRKSLSFFSISHFRSLSLPASHRAA